jgi:dCTP deaminase
VTLADGCILDALHQGLISIEPYSSALLQSASYDVTLGDEFMRPLPLPYGESASILRSDARFPRMHTVKLPRYRLEPGQFCLGTTRERVRIDPTLAAEVSGKSTIGRLGLLVHVTAGWIDPGFEGQITLEFFNCAPYAIELVAGAPIAQLHFTRLTSKCLAPYSGHYQGQQGTTPPKL